MVKKRVDRYVPEIKDGFPPPRVMTSYDTKIFDGSLVGLAGKIQQGQYVEISAGSKGKFKKLVEARGLKTVIRCP